jgi:hypothetical protein
MRAKLKEHPHGIYVLEQFSGAVTADGTRLGHPPIHIHHIHVGPSPGVRQRSDSIGCVLQNKACYGTCLPNFPFHLSRAILSVVNFLGRSHAYF